MRFNFPQLKDIFFGVTELSEIGFADELLMSKKKKRYLILGKFGADIFDFPRIMKVLYRQRNNNFLNLITKKFQLTKTIFFKVEVFYLKEQLLFKLN